MFSEIKMDELSVREKLALVGLAVMIGLGQRLADRLLGDRLPDGEREKLRQDGNMNLWLARTAVKEVVGGARRWI